MLRSLAGVAEVWRGHIDPGGVMDGSYRPLFLSWFGLLGGLFGFAPAIFRFFSLLLHAFNAALLENIGRRLFGLSRRASLCAALLFLLHPSQVTNIGLAWKQSDLWIAFFGLVSVLLAATRPWLVLVPFLLAYGFKESAMVLPLLCLVAEPLYGRSRRSARMGVFVLGLVLAAVYYLWFFSLIPRGEPLPGNTASRLQYFFTELRVLGMYARAWVCPSFLTIDRGVWASPSPGIGGVFLVGLLSVALTGGLLWTWARRIPALTALFLALIWLLPTSSFHPLSLFYDETRLYLVTGFVGIGAALVLCSPRFGRWFPERVFTPLLILGAGVLVLLSFLQTDRWRSEDALWRSALEVDPLSPRAHYHVGLAAQDARALDEAEMQYRDAIRLSPTLWSARLNLGIVLGQKGDLDGAAAEFSALLGKGPQWEARGRYHLGLGALYRGDWRGAREQFELSSKLDPPSGIGLKGLAVLSAREGKSRDAVQFWNAFLLSARIDPEDRKRVPREIAPLVSADAVR